MSEEEESMFEFDPEEFTIGRKLGEGAFGTVHR